MKKTVKQLFIFGLIGLVPMSAGLFFIAHQNSISSIQAFSTKDQLTTQIPKAVLLWSEDGMVTGANLNNWRPVSIAKGENPRWSPDGSRFVFTQNNDVWLISNDLKTKKRILTNVVTETGTGAYWTDDGQHITAIKKSNPRQVIRKSLTSGKIKILHDDGKPPFEGYRLSQCAEIRYQGRYLLTFTRDAGHQSVIVDLKDKQYIANKLMRKGDCEPAWSPDGAFIAMTRRNRRSMNRPLFITRFNPKTGKLTPSEYFIGRGRCHNASISNDSNYVLYVSFGNIFIWHVNGQTEGEQHGIQLTHTKNSKNPNIYIFKKFIPSEFK